LGQDNAGRIIEDINRESTTLVNMLNEFRDRLNTTHEINIQELILERIIPYIHNSPIRCIIQLNLNTRDPMVIGYYMSHSRALVNIISNALEAIKERDINGKLTIELKDTDEQVILTIRDNGAGIESEMLDLTLEGVPQFVGKTSKGREAGEGLGTVQVFETFGADHITVESQRGYGTSWTILLDRPQRGVGRWFSQMERRFHEFEDLIELQHLDSGTKRMDVIAHIWQLRKMEIFLYDVIALFGKQHNIREIYRTVLRYLQGDMGDAKLKQTIKEYKGEHLRFCHWLYVITLMVRDHTAHMFAMIDPQEYRGPLFRSYGQAVNRVMIFTMDPENGRFFAVDRKLAEHLDFVPYLKKPRDELLRGEMIGDLNDHDQPILLGVWSVSSEQDLLHKLQLMRLGARRLLEKSIHPEKILSFYPVTYVQYETEIDTDFTVSLGEFAEFTDEKLLQCTREADDERSYLMPLQD
jgi:anti-sigma regulatory factor (Ser/Thr protein kinase)